MITKTFTKNKDGKIEFTEQELKNLLDEIYKEGRKENNFIWHSPYDSYWYSNANGSFVNYKTLDTTITATDDKNTSTITLS